MKSRWFAATLVLLASSGSLGATESHKATEPQSQSFGPTDVEFEPSFGGWAVDAHATGQANASEQNITINLNNITMSSTTDGDRIRVRGYRVCIAYQKPADDDWHVGDCSQYISCPTRLKPGQTVVLEPSKPIIPATRRSEIGKSWLLMDVEITAPPGQEVTHVYSRGNIDLDGAP